MAAQAKTALREVNERFNNGMLTKEELVPALNYAPWADNISFTQWTALYDWTIGRCTDKEFQAVLKQLEIDVHAEWLELGQPETAEKWKAAKYG